MTITTAEIIEHGRQLSTLIDSAVQELRRASRAEAEAEHAYRLAKARAWLTSGGQLAKEREAFVDADTADARRLRDIAAGEREAARNALRARQAQLDWLRSVISAHRTEMSLAE